MAIFAKKTEKETKTAAPKAVKKVAASKVSKKDVKETTKAVAVSSAPAVAVEKNVHAQPLFTITPHVTEKANFHAEKLNSYTFKVSGNANKISIAHAIEATYKVVPVHVRIVNTADRRVSYRGRITYKSGFKKAYVTLKKGDKIEIA